MSARSPSSATTGAGRRRAVLRTLLGLALAGAFLAGCSTARRAPAASGSTGGASWYGLEERGRPTASGEPMDPTAMTAAHRTLPFGTIVEVRDLATGRTVRVRVNDRGPFIAGRIIDLSHGAAQALGIVERGVAEVRLRIVGRTAEAAPGLSWVVQAGAFRSRAAADRRADAIRGDGFRGVSVVPAGGVYRVRAGPFPTRQAADRAAAALRRAGYEAVVLRADSTE